MANSIIGIPTTRVNDAFIRERMLSQTQSAQVALARLQTQLATGRKFETPSDDPNAALRVMSLQSLIEQKTQVKGNVSTNQSYLSITDSTLTNISGLLAEVNATALGVVGTTATDNQRQIAAQQVQQTLNQLLDTGNQQFRGRYIFAGAATTVRPFEALSSGNVLYAGDNQRISSYGDINLLFDTNVPGDAVFGAISTKVMGDRNLNPVLSFNTRLDDLRGGQGISRGSIRISDGQNVSIVDLSKAQTIGDVAAAIKSNPPRNRAVDVEITANRLVLRLDDAPGALSIQEVGGGTTANELGILREIGQGKTVESRDLDPILRPTTPLADILGTRAMAVVYAAGAENDFIVEADTNGETTSGGTALNGIDVRLVDDPLASEGNETVVYTPGGSIEVHISAGRTKAHDVVNAINAAHAAGNLPFTARLDPLEGALGGRGLIYPSASGVTSGGSGTNFDKTSGFQIVNNDQTNTISLATAQTVEDVLNILNGSGTGVLAEINEAKTGINIRSRVSGCDFSIGENGGQTAAQLGLRSFTRDTTLASLNYGRGVDQYAGSNARSTATFDFGTANSGLVFKAKNPGAQWDNFAVSFTATLGAPSVTYNANAKTLDVQVNAGTTTASDVVRLLNNSPAATADWEVSLQQTPGSTNTGAGKVAVMGRTSTGGDETGIDFTIKRADGVSLPIDIAGKQTVGEILDLINNHPSNQDHKLVAQLAVYGNGIELVDNSEGPNQTTVLRSSMTQAAFDLGLTPTQNAEQSSVPTAGGPATTTIHSTDKKSSLIFSAKSGGSEMNGVRVVFLAGGPAVPVYNNTARTLTFGITAGTTTAADIKTALEASPAGQLFKADFDPADTSGNDGTGAVIATLMPPPTTAGGTATTYASALVSSQPGFDRDLVISAKRLGSTFNNIQVRFEPTPGVAAAVTAYNPGVELVFGFDPGVSTANDIMAALTAHAAANADFTAALDPKNASPNLGEGHVDATTGTEPTLSGGTQTITGRCVGMLETEGIFTALARIRSGLMNNDLYEVERSLNMLDRKVTDMNFTRAELGSRQQGLDTLTTRLDTEEVELKNVLSKDFDADMVQVISEFTGRQAAYEASLQASGKIMKMSLLDYL